MPVQSGITSSTYTSLLIDAGAVYKNYGESGEALLGATRGGNSFVIESEYRDMPVDGAKGMVKGGRRIVNNVARITANFIEIDSTLLALAFPGSTTSDLTTHDSISRDLALATTDYLTNVAILGQVNDGTLSNDFIGILKNVISDGNIEITMNDKDESVLTLQFTAHFDPSTISDEPWEIRWPKT